MSLSVRVNKSDLLAVLKKNRETHRENYERARDGFIKLLTKELEDKLDMIREGERIPQLHFDNRQPEDHTDEYDTIIGMLEMSTDGTIELSYQQYQQWVEDNWNWKQLWTTSNTQYIEAANR